MPRSRPAAAGIVHVTITILAFTVLVTAPGALGAGPTIVPSDSVTTLSVDIPLRGRGNIGGVAVDALGFVYVANFRDAVWRIDTDGTAEEVARTLYGASGNAVNARGDLYQSNFNGNTVSRIRRDGEVETFVAEGLGGPVGLAFDAGGNLYVCNCTAGTISRVTPDGVATEFARSPLFACPNGITRDDHGDFYVVNFNSPDVVRITPDGTVHPFARVTGSGGNGHIAFARGNFFVTQFRGHAVYRISREGEVARFAGDGTREVRDGTAASARFSFPNGIAAGAGGNVLWVNDLVGPYNAGEPTTIVLRRIRLATLGDMIARLPRGTDPARERQSVRTAYASYRAARAWDDTRGDAVREGYRLLTAGRAAAAVALFELNAERYADDAAARFHLGEAYRFTGRPDEAAEEYRSALEIDPKHPQAAARLDLLRRR